MSDDEDCVIVEENINYKSITCDGIPEMFLDKLIAKKHFGKFGKITRFILRPKRLSCTVEYETENDAEEAISNAGEYGGQHFSVKYTANEVSHARNTEEWIDPDVQAELEAMRPQHQQHLRMAGNKAPVAKAPKPIVKTKISSNDAPIAMNRAVDSGVRNELEAILKRPAFGSEDRYRILEARDKLIRLTTVRTTDIKKVVSTKGFCPDMCPEKERLLRENRNQVSVFELEEGSRNVMNNKIAIKEYSRSSADQEAPLAHELRPESVLKMTMTYLMSKIMDLCEADVNIGDWYHFVWDRTRSIRKDITQQELCSLGTVQLVEQCARFHIHCAARLIAEDPSVFDQKINTENLTKCLQTLKYMYHDLRLKNMKCPNEAEFRTYVILLNLNDANFLWEVKQLPEEIQNSKPIRFALAMYLAMESNNYVKFFRLIRETTYMNACILLRYFTQVRLQALQAIIKAYNWPRHMVSIPLSYLKNILAFESVQAARSFFENYNLICDGEKLALDKQAFYIPDVPFVMDRAYTIVEQKRESNVGDAVCGHPLDSIDIFENHIPHNSFDENGYLRPDAWSAEDQLKGPSALAKKSVADVDSNLFKVPLVSPPISPKPRANSIFASKQSLDTSKSPFFQPIAATQQSANSASIFGSFQRADSNAVPKSVVPSVFSIPALGKPAVDAPKFKTSIFREQIAEGTTSTPKDDIFKHFRSTDPVSQVNSIFKQSTREEIDRKLKGEIAEMERQKQLDLDEENRKKIAQEEEEAHKKQLEMEETKIRLAEEQRLAAEAERKKILLKINRKANTMIRKIIDDEIEENVALIATEQLMKHHELLETIDCIANEIISDYIHDSLLEIVKEESTILTKNQTLLQKYFKSWKQNVQRKIAQRKLIESTPIWISDQTINEAHPQQNQTLGMMQRYRLGFPSRIQLKTNTEAPIDLFRLCYKAFHATTLISNRCLVRSRKYFKCVISLPQENDEFKGFNSYMNSWLDKNIARRHDSDKTQEFLCESRQNISICLRKVDGVIPTNESKKRVTTECDHSDGIIFVMTCTNILNARKRLHHLLKLSKIYSKIPVAIIIYNSTADEDYIENELQLQKLIDDEKISFYSLFPSTVFINKNNLREAFEESFKFLAKYTNQSHEMEMQNLSSFLRTSLGDEFWRRLSDSWRINPSFRKVCTQPQKIIELYNDAIDILIKMIDDDYEELPEFPDELKRFVPKNVIDIPVDLEFFPDDWKVESRNRRIQSFLKDLKLQPLTTSIPNNLGQLEQYLLDYSKLSIPNAPTTAERAGYTAIKHLLEIINAPDVQDIPLSDRFNAISWLNIVQSIALELLTHSWHAQYTTLPQEIIYRKSSFKEYNCLPWWFDNVSLKSIKMQQHSKETDDDDTLMGPPKCKKSRIDEEPSFDVNDVLARSVALLQKADRNIEKYKSITARSRDIARTLDEKLYKQELFNRNVKKYLESKL